MKAYREEKRKYDTACKEAIKNRDNACKEADKLCINELKRLFGELEVDIKRFYKSGISKENLNMLADLMNRICAEGAKIGTIPVSYQQKIYKWRQTAADIPEDEEKKNREKEEAAKNTEIKKLTAARADHAQMQRTLLMFVDQTGNAVSEQRLIEQKAVGEKTMTSFELKATNGFCDGRYYLLIMNFDTGAIICAQKYHVNISFANEFDF